MADNPLPRVVTIQSGGLRTVIAGCRNTLAVRLLKYNFDPDRSAAGLAGIDHFECADKPQTIDRGDGVFRTDIRPSLIQNGRLGVNVRQTKDENHDEETKTAEKVYHVRHMNWESDFVRQFPADCEPGEKGDAGTLTPIR